MTGISARELEQMILGSLTVAPGKNGLSDKDRETIRLGYEASQQAGSGFGQGLRPGAAKVEAGLDKITPPKKTLI